MTVGPFPIGGRTLGEVTVVALAVPFGESFSTDDVDRVQHGSGYRPSVEKLFSPKGASAVLHGAMDFMADPAGEARSAFGLS